MLRIVTVSVEEGQQDELAKAEGCSEAPKGCERCCDRIGRGPMSARLSGPVVNVGISDSSARRDVPGGAGSGALLFVGGYRRVSAGGAEVQDSARHLRHELNGEPALLDVIERVLLACDGRVGIRDLSPPRWTT